MFLSVRVALAIQLAVVTVVVSFHGFVHTKATSGETAGGGRLFRLPVVQQPLVRHSTSSTLQKASKARWREAVGNRFSGEGGATSTFQGNTSIPFSQLWSKVGYDTWFNSIAIARSGEPGSTVPQASPGYFMTGGNWNEAPYPFFLVAGDALTGHVAWNDSTSLPPGDVAPKSYGQFGAFSGIDFTTRAAYFATFSRRSAIPIWAARVAAVTDNTAQTGASIATDEDGHVVAVGVTYAPTGAAPWVKIFAENTSSTPTVPLLDDDWRQLSVATKFEQLHLSRDGTVLVAIAAIIQSDGSINSSLVRVYQRIPGIRLPGHSSSQSAASSSSFVRIGEIRTHYVFAACLSAAGEHFQLATTDSVDTLQVYHVNKQLQFIERIVCSPYPPTLPGTFQYVAACRISSAADQQQQHPAAAATVAFVMNTFALFWGDAMNQTAVARYAIPSAPVPVGTLWNPSWLYLTVPTDASLQDTPRADALSDDGSLYAYVSWGGAAAMTNGSIPPTLHLYRTAAALKKLGPILQIATVATGSQTSASLNSLDLAVIRPPPASRAAPYVLIVAVGIDGHENEGSNGGTAYAWNISAAALNDAGLFQFVGKNIACVFSPPLALAPKQENSSIERTSPKKKI